MNINQLLSMTIAHDPSNWPEIECHTLDCDEFVNHKVEDENDLGFVCRNHEVYLEDGPDIHGTAEDMAESIKDSVWFSSFWDRYDALRSHTSLPHSTIWNDAWERADRAYAELENY